MYPRERPGRIAGGAFWFSQLCAPCLIVHSSRAEVLFFDNYLRGKKDHCMELGEKFCHIEVRHLHVPLQFISAHLWGSWPHNHRIKDEQIYVHPPPTLACSPADVKVGDAAGPQITHNYGKAKAPWDEPLTNSRQKPTIKPSPCLPLSKCHEIHPPQLHCMLLE